MSEAGGVRSGAAAGVAAAMAMSGMRRLTRELHLIGEEPPRAIARQKTPGLLAAVPRGYGEAAIELAHWSYGALGGAMFGFLPEAVRRHGLAGPVYGLASWALFEAAIAPALGLEQARRVRAVERIVFAVDHVLYGVLVARSH